MATFGQKKKKRKKNRGGTKDTVGVALKGDLAQQSDTLPKPSTGVIVTPTSNWDHVSMALGVSYIDLSFAPIQYLGPLYTTLLGVKVT